MRTLLLCGTLALSASLALSAQTPESDSFARLEQLVKANTLDREGLRPWHLRMAFTLYDASGKKKEDGTIEEWWASPQSRRLVITSPSYHRTIPSPEASTAEDGREGYLIDELLDQFIQPFPRTEIVEAFSAKQEDRTIAKVKLTCLSLTPKSNYSPKSSDSSAFTFCTDVGSDVLRLKQNAEEYFVRNRPARFQNTNLAMDNAILYEGRSAIEGHVELLQTFDPEKTAVELDKQVDTPTVPGVLTAGKLLRKVPPDYPEAAKLQHVSGTVTLYGVIATSGHILSLDVISSPNLLLSGAALDAVKQWVYAPYFLNGKATEVNTTIMVHFNLNR